MFPDGVATSHTGAVPMPSILLNCRRFSSRLASMSAGFGETLDIRRMSWRTASTNRLSSAALATKSD
jgi:hypothetical protein